MEQLLVLGEYSLRIVLAAVCGGIIGRERSTRRKEAGIRTHTIVAIASALMMIVSKYGFSDLVFGADFRLDPSRVASQIVSGVGFLGAGVIFVQNRTVQGLTTAAGIWATSGVGMAIGSGMYTMGVFTSVVIILVQLIFHKTSHSFHQQSEEVLSFSVVDNEEAMEYLKKYIMGLDANVIGIHTHKENKETLEVEITMIADKEKNLLNFLDYDRTKIRSISV